MRTSRGVATAVAVSLALAGCGNPPTHGVVTHKQKSDAYSYVTTTCSAYSTVTVGSGASRTTIRNCTAYSSHTWHRPAIWELCLENREDTSHDAEGCREVDQATWYRYNEGDYYPDKNS